MVDMVSCIVVYMKEPGLSFKQSFNIKDCGKHYRDIVSIT